MLSLNWRAEKDRRTIRKWFLMLDQHNLHFIRFPFSQGSFNSDEADGIVKEVMWCVIKWCFSAAPSWIKEFIQHNRRRYCMKLRNRGLVKCRTERPLIYSPWGETAPAGLHMTELWPYPVLVSVYRERCWWWRLQPESCEQMDGEHRGALPHAARQNGQSLQVHR